MNTPTGQSKVSIIISDLTSIIGAAVKGIVAFQGVTEKGPVNKPVLISSWPEYQRVFGGLYIGATQLLFPLLCKRALEAGARLRINRIDHYTDITDKSTAVSVKASKVVAGLKFIATSATPVLNSAPVIVKYPKSGKTTTVDIIIPSFGSIQAVDYRDFPRAFTQNDIDKFNDASPDINIVLIGSTTPIAVDTATVDTNATGNLTGGTYNPDLITEVDHAGDTAAATGLHAFDEYNDFTRICIPAVASPTLDVTLADYADSRGDIRAILRTPLGLNANGIIDYRRHIGSYAGSPRVSTWRASMVTGGLMITHPITGVPMNIPELGDVVGKMATKDRVIGEWFSAGGPKRGIIKNTIGVVYNLGTAARQFLADDVDAAGVNAVINTPAYGTVLWGNGTLYEQDTMLKFENVADLMIIIPRMIKPIAQSFLFDPNDLSTWKSLYRKIKPVLDYLKENRAISDYAYLGDQDAERLEDVTINKFSDIDAGIYTAIIGVKAIAALKFIYMSVAMANSGVSFKVLEQDPTV